MKKFLKVLPVLLLFVVLALASCSEISDSNGGNGGGVDDEFAFLFGTWTGTVIKSDGSTRYDKMTLESPNKYLFEYFSDTAHNNMVYGEKGTFNVKNDPTNSRPINMKITNISVADPPPTYNPITYDYSFHIKKINDSCIELYYGVSVILYTKHP